MKVIEIFNSIQGEGVFVGTPMTFIRLQECNLRCSFCDTKPWESIATQLSCDEVIRSCRLQPDGVFPNVCITGGEPLLEPLTDLLWLLLGEEQVEEIHIETNGSEQVWKDGLDRLWPKFGVSLTVSPKEPTWTLEKMLTSSLSERVTDIKILVSPDGPTYPLRQFKDWPGVICLQPIDDGHSYNPKTSAELVLPWLMKYPFCTMSLQLHKILGIR